MKSLNNSRRALNLALAIYRITEKFPFGEVLTGQLRKSGNEIAISLALGERKEFYREFEKILILFEIAMQQNWISDLNWPVLIFEYNKLKQEADFLFLKKGDNAEIVSHNIKAKKENRIMRLVEISERQKMILSKMRAGKAAKISDLAPLFKNISERTLRTDLQILVKAGFLEKKGNNKTSVYSVS